MGAIIYKKPGLNLRSEFKAFRDQPDLVYLDNAATSQMPDLVLEEMMNYEQAGRGNAGRGFYPWCERAFESLEAGREKVANYFGVDGEGLFFTAGATAGLNTVLKIIAPKLSFHRTVVVSNQEHLANYLPWKKVVGRLVGRVVEQPLNDPTCTAVTLTPSQSFFGRAGGVVAVTAVGNLSGMVTDLLPWRELADSLGSKLVVDAAQLGAHSDLIKNLALADAVVFSAHKMYGPMGLGAVWLSKSFRDEALVLNWGGGIGADSELRTRRDIRRFEAGTQNVMAVVGWSKAIEWLTGIDSKLMRAHEEKLLDYYLFKSQEIPEINNFLDQLSGERVGIQPFILDGIHPHEVAEELGERGVMVRAGEHCSIFTKHLNSTGVVRWSAGVYNDLEDIDRLINGLKAVSKRWC